MTKELVKTIFAQLLYISFISKPEEWEHFFPVKLSSCVISLYFGLSVLFSTISTVFFVDEVLCFVLFCRMCAFNVQRCFIKQRPDDGKNNEKWNILVVDRQMRLQAVQREGVVLTASTLHNIKLIYYTATIAHI